MGDVDMNVSLTYGEDVGFCSVPVGTGKVRDFW